MDIRTIIYMDASNDSKVLVTESVDDVKKLVEQSTGKQIITLTLRNGNPIYLLRNHITYFTKYH